MKFYTIIYLKIVHFSFSKPLLFWHREQTLWEINWTWLIEDTISGLRRTPRKAEENDNKVSVMQHLVMTRPSAVCTLTIVSIGIDFRCTEIKQCYPCYIDSSTCMLGLLSFCDMTTIIAYDLFSRSTWVYNTVCINQGLEHCQKQILYISVILMIYRIRVL